VSARRKNAPASESRWKGTQGHQIQSSNKWRYHRTNLTLSNNFQSNIVNSTKKCVMLEITGLYPTGGQVCRDEKKCHGIPQLNQAALARNLALLHNVALHPPNTLYPSFILDPALSIRPYQPTAHIFGTDAKMRWRERIFFRSIFCGAYLAGNGGF
jgi:hypothetical protein